FNSERARACRRSRFKNARGLKVFVTNFWACVLGCRRRRGGGFGNCDCCSLICIGSYWSSVINRVNGEDAGAPLRHVDEGCLVCKTRSIRGRGYQSAAVRAHPTGVGIRALVNVDVVLVCAALPVQLSLHPLADPIGLCTRNGDRESFTGNVFNT